MPRVLASAESFGFGPAAKLRSVCARLGGRGFACHFVGEGSALTFAECNRSTFASLTGLNSMTDLASIDAADVDVAISVMDPFMPVWAHVNGVPCVYVDSLFWLWQWPSERQDDLRRQAQRLAAIRDAEAALLDLAALPMHDGQFVAHLLSTVNCVQSSPGDSARADTLRRFTRVRKVEAIVDVSHRGSGRPSYWLATASGMINPLLPPPSAVDWLRAACQLIEEAADASGSPGQVVLAGNREVHELAGDMGSDRIKLMSMDHGAMLRTLNDAYACLTPPGLTTILECAGYEVPVILLPEQHYGHLANFQNMSRRHPGTFPHGLIDPDGAGPAAGKHLDETLAVADRLQRHFQRRDRVWQRMVAGVADGMRQVMRYRASLAAAQKVAIDRFVGGYDGVAQVVAAVESVAHGPRVPVTAQNR